MPRGPIATDPMERFWPKVDKSGDCWEWTGCRHPEGYGRFNPYGEIINSHRFIFELEGSDIPSGMIVCHHCDNPPCVNPDHLYLGTHMDNTRDKINRGNQLRGEDHPRSKLSEENVKEIRDGIANGIECKFFAKQFNLSTSNISSIKNRKSWKHI